MAGFTKLFSSIITSSIWSEDDKTRLMWITMLAVADATGHVDGAVPGLADIARMSLEDAKRAIAKLEGPDPYSRTPDNEGRRIEKVKGGWRILNYQEYRERRDPEKRREQNREAKRRQRQRERQHDVSQNQPKSAEAEAEAEAENNTSPNGDVCPKRQQKAAARTYRIGFDYDTNFFTGLTDEDLRVWSEAYPAVDIAVELRRAAIWMRDNPTKRKKNIQGFLSRWFSRTQERGGNRGRAPARGIREVLDDFWAGRGKDL